MFISDHGGGPTDLGGKQNLQIMVFEEACLGPILDASSGGKRVSLSPHLQSEVVSDPRMSLLPIQPLFAKS